MWKNIASNCFAKQLFLYSPFLCHRRVKCAAQHQVWVGFMGINHIKMFSFLILDYREREFKMSVWWSGLSPAFSKLTALALSYPGKESAVTTVPLRQSAPH